MRPGPISTFLLFAALLPTAARAQTLRVEVTADGALPVDAEVPADVSARRSTHESAYDEVPVVVVVPVDDTPRDAVAHQAYDDVPRPGASAPSPAVEPAREEPIEEDLQGGSFFGAWAEGMDLSSLGFDLSSPEVAALGGTHIGAPQGLGTSTVGGVVIGAGVRAEGFLRAPELRVILGGGDTGGAWTRVDGTSLEVQTRGLFVVQLEAAMGLQVELGPVVPYVLARASIGGAFLDVNVRDDRLGRLGTEHADALLLQAGIEAGVELHTHDGMVVGGAFRGSFAGTPSYGGVLSLGFVSE